MYVLLMFTWTALTIFIAHLENFFLYIIFTVTGSFNRNGPYSKFTLFLSRYTIYDSIPFSRIPIYYYFISSVPFSHVLWGAVRIAAVL